MQPSVRAMKQNASLSPVLLLAATALCFPYRADAESKKGEVTKVYGKIQIVDAFPDYKVRVVKHFPDLKVQVVESFPNAPGKWRFVKSFPDFKIQFVKSGEDFTVQFVKAFPGQ